MLLFFGSPTPPPAAVTAMQDRRKNIESRGNKDSHKAATAATATTVRTIFTARLAAHLTTAAWTVGAGPVALATLTTTVYFVLPSHGCLLLKSEAIARYPSARSAGRFFQVDRLRVPASSIKGILNRSTRSALASATHVNVCYIQTLVMFQQALNSKACFFGRLGEIDPVNREIVDEYLDLARFSSLLMVSSQQVQISKRFTEMLTYVFIVGRLRSTATR